MSIFCQKLTDGYNRSFPYLRLSVTEVCNFRCQYCLPNGYLCDAKKKYLSIDEIKRLTVAFSELGTWKIRVTGGEPTVRKDFTKIVETVSSVPGIKEVAFTTNGYRLKEFAQEWRDAGATNINISVDSLDPKKFKEITGHDRLQDVLEGINAASEAGFKKIKINSVLLKDVNDKEFDRYLKWVKGSNLSIRFIELMQTGDNLDYFLKYHLSADVLKEKLLREGWQEAKREIGSGPAINFSHPDYKGTVGIIAPYSKDFCKNCNRLRVTSEGDLRLCLFGNQGVSLRPLLECDDQKEDVKKLIQDQLIYKKESHFLFDGNTGITPHLASVGG